MSATPAQVERMLAAGVVASEAEAQALAAGAAQLVERGIARDLDAAVDAMVEALTDSQVDSTPIHMGDLIHSVPRELADESASVLAVIEARRAGPLTPEQAEEIGLAALTPQRAAHKRMAMAQRRSREARR